MFYKEFSDNWVFAICYRFKTCLTYKIYYIFRCNIALKILHEILMHDIKIFTMFPVNSQGCSFLPLCRCHFTSVFKKKKKLSRSIYVLYCSNLVCKLYSIFPISLLILTNLFRRIDMSLCISLQLLSNALKIQCEYMT